MPSFACCLQFCQRYQDQLGRTQQMPMVRQTLRCCEASPIPHAFARCVQCSRGRVCARVCVWKWKWKCARPVLARALPAITCCDELRFHLRKHAKYPRPFICQETARWGSDAPASLYGRHHCWPHSPRPRPTKVASIRRCSLYTKRELSGFRLLTVYFI